MNHDEMQEKLDQYEGLRGAVADLSDAANSALHHLEQGSPYLDAKDYESTEDWEDDLRKMEKAAEDSATALRGPNGSIEIADDLNSFS